MKMHIVLGLKYKPTRAKKEKNSLRGGKSMEENKMEKKKESGEKVWGFVEIVGRVAVISSSSLATTNYDKLYVHSFVGERQRSIDVETGFEYRFA